MAAAVAVVVLCQCLAYEAEDRLDAFAVQDWLSSLLEELPADDSEPSLIDTLGIEMEPGGGAPARCPLGGPMPACGPVGVCVRA